MWENLEQCRMCLFSCLEDKLSRGGASGTCGGWKMEATGALKSLQLKSFIHRRFPSSTFKIWHLTPTQVSWVSHPHHMWRDGSLFVWIRMKPWMCLGISRNESFLCVFFSSTHNTIHNKYRIRNPVPAAALKRINRRWIGGHLEEEGEKAAGWSCYV